MRFFFGHSHFGLFMGEFTPDLSVNRRKLAQSVRPWIGGR
jgi:hypothetical protein